MEFDSKDNEIVKLLTKLKNANGSYPKEMLALRRQGYLKQVAEISGGAALALGLRNTIKTTGGSGGATTAGTLLETLLVVAIVAEASTVAYFYRDKVAELFRNSSNAPRVEEVSNPPVIPSPIPEFELTISPVVTETQTPVGTPTPSLDLAAEATDQGNSQGSGQESGSSQAVSTPNPNENNGNQYGLTPKPERTRETDSNNNQDTNPGSNRNR
jgi:hypothetical protein